MAAPGLPSATCTDGTTIDLVHILILEVLPRFERLHRNCTSKNG
jgi:hypothetical protein